MQLVKSTVTPQQIPLYLCAAAHPFSTGVANVIVGKYVNESSTTCRNYDGDVILYKKEQCLLRNLYSRWATKTQETQKTELIIIDSMQ